MTTIETDVALRNARAIPWYHVDPAVRAIDGRTLVVYDSFFGTSEERIAPWFRESLWVHYNDLLYHPELVDDLPPFDGIVLERAERHAHSVDAMDLLGRSSGWLTARARGAGYHPLSALLSTTR